MLGKILKAGLVAIFVSAMLIPGVLFAQSNTLIKLEKGKPMPALAKSWTKVSVGKLEFKLDTKAQLARGKVLTPQYVKNSLESKLGTTFNCTVEPKGKDAVVVSFSGDENKFLEKVATTIIRPRDDVAIALDGPTSEGGIRAKIPVREPEAGEIKARVISEKDGVFEILVVKKGKDVAKEVAVGKNIKANLDKAAALKKGDWFYCKVGNQEKDVWNTSDLKKE